MSSTSIMTGSTAHQRYVAENRRLLHKRSRVSKSSHGKWQYEALVTHGQRMQRLAEERKRAEAQAAERAGTPTQSPRKVA